MNHRSNKKIKLDSNGQKKTDFGRSNNKNGSSIHSGHYMTSTLHDQNEDTVEMPIASPDASINEVTLNANLNADQDNYNDHENEAATNSTQSVNNKIQSSASNNLIINSNVSNIKNSTIKSNPTANLSVRKVMINGKIQVVSNSISGGITLDKTNKSLKNLMCYIKASYSNNLTSPKWKNFKGLKLQVTEKIRLNNVIWRSWFEQYGIKDNVKHRKRRLICQFANGLEEQPVSTKMSITEGKFWKARLESIKNEYNKWREISRKQIKATNDGTQLETVNIIQTFDRKTPIRIATPLGLINANTNINLNLSSSSLNSLASNSSNNNINNSTNNQASFILNNNSVQTNTNYQTSFYENNQIPSNLSNFQNFPNQPNTNYYFNHQSNTGFGVVQNDLNPPEYVVQQSTDNFANFNSNPNNIQQNNFMIQNSFQSSEIPNQNKISSVITTSTISSGSPTSSFTTSTSSANPQTSYHHLPIASKQMPYNNRCRSPSPGLFQDFDLYNFSSDTLFSTYLVEDPKDTIFGTNPDLFQPDLMHMYPNFDFFDLQEDVFNLNETNKKQEENSPQSNSNPQSITESSSRNNSNSNLKNDNSNSNFGTQLSDSTQAVVQETADPNAQSQSQQTQLISIDYSDLSNFNTLATVAAAQSLNLTSSNNGNTNTQIQQRSQKVRHMSDIGDFNHLKNSNQSIINDVNHHQLKLPVSLSQINTNLNSNPIQQQPQQQVQTTSQQFNSIINSSNTNFTKSLSSNQQTNTTSTSSTNSSNTIRNLLALNSPSIQMQTNNNNTNNNTNSNNSNKQNTNNIRLLTGVLTASGNSIPSPNRKAHQQQIYQQQQQSLTNLINNSNQPRVQSPPNMMLQLSSQNQAKVVKSDSNQPFTSLLSAVLGTNQSNDLQINQVIPNQTQEQLMDQLQSLNKTTNRRGRKAANETIINQTINQRGNSKGSSSRNSSQHKFKKDELIINQSQQLSNSNMINVNEATDSSSNSPTQSPRNNFNPTFQVQQIQASSSNSNFQANDSNSNEFSLLSKYSRINSNPTSSSVKSNELYPPPPSVNGSISGSRMSRSNSVNSLNAMNESNFTSAEQKRRCNIQHGFDRLQVLVPALRDGKNLKVSKAVMLQKTSEYIKELQQAREKRMSDLEIYKKEIEELSDKITECQNELPANGVSVVGNLNKTEKFEHKFNQYVKDKTLNNWKFYLFSLILKPLFDNFIQTVNTSSKEDMEKTFYEWQQKYCNLVQLRPIASTALRHLSRSTSILTDSSKLPEECYSMALTKI